MDVSINRYQEERIRKEELARKKKEDFEEYKKLLDEENQKEKERLALSRQWELNRRMRETEVLNDLEKLHNQAIIDEKKHFREHLDAQCVSHNKKFVVIEIRIYVYDIF